MKDWELEMHLEQIKSAQERTARAQEEANRIALERGRSHSSGSLGLSWKTKLRIALKIFLVITIIAVIRMIFMALVSEYEAEINVLYEQYIGFLQNLVGGF